MIWGTANFGTSVPALIISNSLGIPTVRPMLPINGYIGTAAYPFREIRGLYHYAGLTLLTSDKRLKQNFRTINNPLEKLLQLNGTEYDYIPDSSDTIGNKQEKEKNAHLKKNKLGFIAQEAQEIVPEAVVYDTETDRYYMDYNAIIPVIVEAMKEQQSQIELLTKQMEKLSLKSNEKSAFINQNNSTVFESATLSQNIPNPFSQSTKINMYVPSEISKAILYVYTMQGVQIDKFEIFERGDTFTTIEGHTLKAGMYLYTLIADGKEVDTKKMILTK